jgi:transcriptional regulator with XRE-family HTH domain
MARKTAPLLPGVFRRLQSFGERLRMARLRRRLPAKLVAERAGMSTMTLRSLERGGAGVTIGAYLAVLQVLGMDEDLDLLAREDTLGRALQDARLSPQARSREGYSVAPDFGTRRRPSRSGGDPLKRARRSTGESPRSKASEELDVAARKRSDAPHTAGRTRPPREERGRHTVRTDAAQSDSKRSDVGGGESRRSVSSDELAKLIRPNVSTSKRKR